MKWLCKCVVLALIGGLVYYVIEVLWRGRSHWTMAVLGGLCFVLCGLINEPMPREVPLWKQMVLCSAVITMMELAAGLILNEYLGLGIWDYSQMPFNFLGQICLPYTVLWLFLSVPAIMLDDWLRHRLFGQDCPRYRFF